MKAFGEFQNVHINFRVSSMTKNEHYPLTAILPIWVEIFCPEYICTFCVTFVRFHGDFESKWAFGELKKKYSKESNGMGLFLIEDGSI